MSATKTRSKNSGCRFSSHGCYCHKLIRGSCACLSAQAPPTTTTVVEPPGTSPMGSWAAWIHRPERYQIPSRAAWKHRPESYQIPCLSAWNHHLNNATVFVARSMAVPTSPWLCCPLRNQRFLFVRKSGSGSTVQLTEPFGVKKFRFGNEPINLISFAKLLVISPFLSSQRIFEWREPFIETE